MYCWKVFSSSPLLVRENWIPQKLKTEYAQTRPYGLEFEAAINKHFDIIKFFQFFFSLNKFCILNHFRPCFFFNSRMGSVVRGQERVSRLIFCYQFGTKVHYSKEGKRCNFCCFAIGSFHVCKTGLIAMKFICFVNRKKYMNKLGKNIFTNWKKYFKI